MTDSRRKCGLDGNGNPNYGWDSRDHQLFYIKNSIIDKILTVRLKGLFWARNNVGCSFGFVVLDFWDASLHGKLILSVPLFLYPSEAKSYSSDNSTPYIQMLKLQVYEFPIHEAINFLFTSNVHNGKLAACFTGIWTPKPSLHHDSKGDIVPLYFL